MKNKQSLKRQQCILNLNQLQKAKIMEKSVNTNQFIREYLKSDDFIKNAKKFGLFNKNKIPIHTHKRLETRTRKQNPNTALSFAVHDPLWMLTRQWQFGEFKGNDAGSAIWAKIKIEHDHIETLQNGNQKQIFDIHDVLEHKVERLNTQITHAIRVEAAYYLKKSLDFSTLKEHASSLLKHWQNLYPLSAFPNKNEDLLASSKSGKEVLDTIKKKQNTHLESYLAGFGKRCFDGHQVFLDYINQNHLDNTIAKMLTADQQKDFLQIMKQFTDWFRSTYLPIDETGNKFWINEKLGYEFCVETQGKEKENTKKKYSVEDYCSGKLSWYSFDIERNSGKNSGKNEKFLSFIPVLADFPGAPNKRLWAFEDAKIAMGNSELSANALANAVVLQYTTMYGNDWLITPMELNAGTVSTVKGIIITDVFGNRYYINQPAGETSKNERYTNKWEMFTIAQKDAYSKGDFSTDGCLFYPPSIPRTEESKPLEEVQFLRDEMANMVWGVELTINDGCGSTLDGDEYATKISAEIEEMIPKYNVQENEDIDYTYLFQNNAPLNWIPFSPVKMPEGTSHGDREIRLQRSTMPLYLKDGFIPIRPNTYLMRYGIDEDDTIYQYQFINEEEILAVGTKIQLSYQRTRWFNGKIFNWLGAKKEVSQTQANSGLSFDELIEKVTQKASKLDLRDKRE